MLLIYADGMEVRICFACVFFFYCFGCYATGYEGFLLKKKKIMIAVGRVQKVDAVRLELSAASTKPC